MWRLPRLMIACPHIKTMLKCHSQPAAGTRGLRADTDARA
jgi:hypothetical protein